MDNLYLPNRLSPSKLTCAVWSACSNEELIVERTHKQIILVQGTANESSMRSSNQ
jgi:hypothetical protein